MSFKSKDRKKDKKNKELGFAPRRTSSLESTASASSAASVKGSRRASTEGVSDFAGITQYGQYLFDVCATVVYCPKHKKYALSKAGSGRGLWLPYCSVRTSEGWYACIVNYLKKILVTGHTGQNGKNYLSFKAPEMIHIFRLQIPQFFEYVTRVTFYTELTHDARYSSACCESNRYISWYTAQEMIQLRSASDGLLGPEPMVFTEIENNNIVKGSYTEYTLRDATKYLPREPPKTFQDEMIKSAGFTEKDILRVYSDFIQHCYPSQYMVLQSFVDYMVKIGWNRDDTDLPHYYRSFGFNRNSYLSFHEFLLGLAAMDKNTHHGGHSGELRCGYIFRYYDRDDDQKLDHDELRNLTRDVLKSKGTYDEQTLESELTKNYQNFGVAYKEPIDEQKLLKAIGTMQFRGSSPLFRSTLSALQQIRLKRVYDSIELIEASMTAVDTKVKRAKGTCPKCKEKRYTLAMHTVKISSDGSITEPLDTDAKPDVSRMPRERRVMSNIAFLAETIANVILDNLRDFADSGAVPGLKSSGASKLKPKNEQLVWVNPAKRPQLLDKINKLCSDAEALFRKEPRVIKVNSPVYVLGDIHGNFRDLMQYEKMLWKHGPTCTAANYLFLGDYVDRGDYSLECILYLLACKLIAPDKYCLLRGNHELRPIQCVFTFKKECDEKFGKHLGSQIWESLNKVFDVMPLCAIIDDSIFCAHGGIPTSATRIEELMKIPSPLSEPETQSPAAWEILWNDPVNGNEFTDYSEIVRNQSGSSSMNNVQGFLPNTKRGTAYYFSDDAINRFLTTNGLSHVIRAHEVIAAGFQYHMGGRVITVFSSSKYCGGLNESACAFVDQEKIRIMRLETKD